MKNIILILFLFGGVVQAQTLLDTIEVVIVAGQSQSGTQHSSADSLPLSWQSQANDVILWRADLGKPYAYFPGPDRVEYNTSLAEFDYGFVLGKLKSAETGGRILIVKHSVGGTKLGSNAISGGVSWLPAEAELYSELIAEYNAAKAYYTARLTYMKVIAILWLQGEADASVQGLADTYEANLNTFIDALNTEIGQSPPWVLSLLRTNNLTGATRCCDVQVRNIITTVAGQRGYPTIDLNSYDNPAGLDQTHLGEVGVQVGNHFYNAWKTTQQ